MPDPNDATPEDPALLLACAEICAVYPEGGFEVAKNICDVMTAEGFILADKDAMKWCAENPKWVMDNKNNPAGHPTLVRQYFKSVADQVGQKKCKRDEEAMIANQRALAGAATEAALRQVTAAAHDAVGGDSVRKLGSSVQNSTAGVPLSQQNREIYTPVKEVPEHERPTFELVTNCLAHTVLNHINFDATNFPTAFQQKQGEKKVGKETNPLCMMDRIKMLNHALCFGGAISPAFAADLNNKISGVYRLLADVKGDGRDSSITDSTIVEEMEKHWMSVVNHMLAEGRIEDGRVPAAVWNEHGRSQMIMRKLFERKEQAEGKSEKACQGCEQLKREFNSLTRRMAELEKRGSGKGGGKAATFPLPKGKAKILKGTRAQCSYHATSPNGCIKGAGCPLAKDGRRGEKGWKLKGHNAPDESDIPESE